MRIRWRLTFGVLVLLFAAAFSVLEYRGRDRRPWVRDADVPVLEQQGDSLRRVLERHRQRQGAYPRALAETGLDELLGRASSGRGATRGPTKGGLEAPVGQGPYTLAVGDYDRHHFELSWDWRRGGWAWNR